MGNMLDLQGMPEGFRSSGSCISLISYVGSAAPETAELAEETEAAGGWCISLISYVAVAEEAAQAARSQPPEG